MTGGGGGVGCPLVHFSFVETNLVCGPVVLSCIAINGPDEKFQNDLLISFLSMKIGNIEKFARGISLLEIHLMFSVISNILADISRPIDRPDPARVLHSHWSRSLQTLCSDWWRTSRSVP